MPFVDWPSRAGVFYPDLSENSGFAAYLSMRHDSDTAIATATLALRAAYTALSHWQAIQPYYADMDIPDWHHPLPGPERDDAAAQVAYLKAVYEEVYEESRALSFAS